MGDKSSFTFLKRVMEDRKKYSPNTPVILAGLKVDIVNRKVNSQEALDFANQNNFVYLFSFFFFLKK